jgi:hypothetical protein
VRPRWFASVRSLALVALAAPSAAAQTPPVDACGRSIRVDAAGDGALSLRGLGAAVTLAGATAELTRVELSGGVAVIVRTRTDAGPTEGALVVCGPGRPPSLLWRGSLRWEGEDLGDRARHDLTTLDGAVVVGRRRESPRLCGSDPVLGDARRLNPAATALVAVALDPTAGVSVRVETLRAEAVMATMAAYTPRVAVASQGEARALFDRDPATAWTVTSGYVTLPFASAALQLRGVDLVPAAGRRGGRVTLLVEPGPRRFEVELPSAPPAGGAWRVTFPEPIAARCLSLVGSGVTLATVALRTQLDDGAAALRTLAEAAGAAAGDDAARLLVDLGSPGVQALVDALPGMTVSGARRALRLLAASPGPAVSAALARSLARDDVADAAAEALRRRGPDALDALSAQVTEVPRASALLAALAAPTTGRLRALAPVLAAEGASWTAGRDALRDVLREALRAGELDAWLGSLPEGARERSRALRLAAEVTVDDPAVAARVAALARALWAVAPSSESAAGFETRYRLLPALIGDADGAQLATRVLTSDGDHDLRAEAARVLARRDDATAALVAALTDRAPRVRAAAATALAGRAAATEALQQTLANDRWPAVAAAAAAALAHEPRATASLLAALDARSMVTVRAALTALAESPGAGVSTRLVAFAQEGRRNPRLRRDAVDALGARCDRAVANDLEHIAAELTDPALPPWEQEIGHAALAALARLDAPRARAFLERSEANAEAHASVDRAARQGCAAAP